MPRRSAGRSISATASRTRARSRGMSRRPTRSARCRTYNARATSTRVSRTKGCRRFTRWCPAISRGSLMPTQRCSAPGAERSSSGCSRGAMPYAHVIERTGVPGYCFGRRGRLFDQIGPVVATDDEAARALVRASLAAADGRAVVVDAFDREQQLHGVAAQLRIHRRAAALPHVPRRARGREQFRERTAGRCGSSPSWVRSSVEGTLPTRFPSRLQRGAAICARAFAP